jgi:hypothetical protein
MIKKLLIGMMLVSSLTSFGQEPDIVCRKVKGQKSRILQNQRTGVMDTTLCRLSGEIIQLEGSKPMEGTILNVKNTSTNKSTGTVSNDEGKFDMWLEQGNYELEIIQVGFDKAVFKKINIGSGEIRQLKIGLGRGTYFIMTDKKKKNAR